MSKSLLTSLALSLVCLFACCGGGSNNSNGGGNNGGGNGGGGSTPPPPASNTPFWAQWGANPQHDGLVSVAGQSATHQLADIIYDPFVAQAQAESGGDLLSHYQAALVDGNDVYMMVKSGQYTACNPHQAWTSGTACGPNAWQSMIWNEARFTWINNTLTKVWTFQSDWKPEPNGNGLGGWEPVFHPVEANNFLYVPGAGGTVWKVDKTAGTSSAHINPFTSGVNPVNTYVSGPLAADGQGNIYYNAIELASPSAGDPWSNNDVVSAWLVKITPSDVTSKVSYATLVQNAPAGTSVTCEGRFSGAATLPWPPSVSAVPNPTLCGSQRPGVNVAPAVAPDGTIFTASRAHFNARTTYMIAVNPDLTLKWVSSMQHLLNDGCGAIVPIAPANNPNQANSCRNGTNLGVDPTTNSSGSALIDDQSSSSPTALPDGSVLFGALGSYNGARGHLFKFDSLGNFAGAYDFGWDSTPAVWQHNGTYSIVIKDNHYQTGLYCNLNNPVCQPLPDGPYYITQLDASLNVEWQFQSTNTQSCHRVNGSLSCVSDHPNGFEWCINMPAVDSAGNVYANSEDGNLYVIPQGHSGVFATPQSNLFLNLAIGAAYTPLSIGSDGRIYTQNDGHLFVVGN